MTEELPTITGPIDTMRKGGRPRALVGLAASVIGSALAIGGFYGMIVDALNGAGAGIGQVVTLLGIAFTVIGLVIGIIGLVRRGHTALSIATIVIAVVPELFFAILVIAVRV
jgi:hypothetical protein